MYQAGECHVLASTAVELMCCSLLLETEDLSAGRSHTSNHSRAASSVPLGFISVAITTDILSCPHASCLVKLELLSTHPCSHFRMGSAAPTRFSGRFLSASQNHHSMREGKVLGKWLVLQLKWKVLRDICRGGSLTEKAQGEKLLLEGEFTLLNLCKEFQSLMSFNSCYHFQDVNSLCHKHYLFSQHPSSCASLLDTEGWMKNSQCLRKTLTLPCQSLQELSSVFTAVRWKYGPVNSVWYLFSIA